MQEKICYNSIIKDALKEFYVCSRILNVRRCCGTFYRIMNLSRVNHGVRFRNIMRMFLRFLTLMRKELPYQTPLDEIDIKWIDAPVLDTVSSSEVFDFLSYLTNDRQNREGPADVGIAAAARARKLSAI